MKGIKKVCVAGGGLMGRQIALNTALHGFEVFLTDSAPAVLEAVDEWVCEYLDGRLKKGKLTEEAVGQAKQRLCVVPTLEVAAKDADLVIEAIIEDQGIKEAFFRQADGIVSEDCILVTNSSYMVSSTFASCVRNPSRLANLHYFNPALVMKLTEVVQGPHTSAETVNALMEFSRNTGKDPVWVRKEIDGFIANRLLRAVTNEALYLLDNGIATAQEIDTAAEKGLNYPMGPFRLQDLTGIDLAYLAARKVAEDTGFQKPGYKLLEQKYQAKEFGRKSGKGWYDYS